MLESLTGNGTVCEVSRRVKNGLRILGINTA